MLNNKEVNVYQVGGSVRDEIMGLKSKDLDYSVECDSYETMRQYIIDSGGEIFLETPKFFTIRANVPGLGASDFVLCRKDGLYSDKRRPDEVTVGTISDDLARRDFTMNAIAKCMKTGKFLDPYDGRGDIQKKLIKCVGIPEDRFKEDMLRVFRAIRFAVTKRMMLSSGIIRFLAHIEPKDLYMANISQNRVRDELTKAFAYDTLRAFNFLILYPVLREFAFSCVDNKQDKPLWLKPTNEYA